MTLLTTRKMPRRFWDKVLLGDGCWEWTAAKHHGYGIFGMDQRTFQATHIAWELWHGSPPPPGMFVCHRCDNPGCVRPDHLFVGTQTDNMRDMTAKGRNIGSKFHGLKTHCAEGHPYDDENTYRINGRRHCRACRRATMARLRAAKRTKVERLAEGIGGNAHKLVNQLTGGGSDGA